MKILPEAPKQFEEMRQWGQYDVISLEEANQRPGAYLFRSLSDFVSSEKSRQRFGVGRLRQFVGKTRYDIVCGGF